MSDCGRQADQQAVYDQISRQLEVGELDQARAASRHAWERAPETQWGWKFKAEYILTSLYRGELAEAEKLLSVAIPSGYVALRPRYQYLRAYFLLRSKNQSAFREADLARSMAKQQGDFATEAEALILEAILDKSRQLDFLKQALAIARRGGLAFLQADALSEIGLIMHDRGQYSDAVSFLAEAAAQAKIVEARLMRTTILSNLGECYLNLGDLDRGMIALKDARSQLRPSDPQSLRANVNMELGKIYSLLQENSEAVVFFRDAFEIVRADPKLDTYAPVAQKLSAALIENRQLDEAEKYNELSFQALKQDNPPPAFPMAFYSLNQADIAAQRKDTDSARTLYQNLLRLPGDELSSIRWPAFARLAELEAQLGHVSAAQKNFESALTAIEENRSQQTATEHQITFLSALIRFYQQYVEFLISQGRYQEALGVADSSRASVLTQGLDSSRKETNFFARVSQEARRSNSAVLFYWLAPLKSYVWAITPAGEDFQELPGSSMIAKDVQDYSRAIQAADEDPLVVKNAAGLRLYETLIKPVSSHFKKGMRVVVVPDGTLHGLNFETLIVPGDTPRYWLDDVSITVAPSLRILLDKSPVEKHPGGALVIGDGDYSAAGNKYPPLPESKKEVASVSALFPTGSTVLTGKQAVPEAYAKAKPNSFSLIHFSAHVEASENSPLDSAIILSPGEFGRRELYARDLMKNPLHANLVTISGCSSVGKKVLSGEGMVGFAWAAFEAGAHNAVTSLWEVDDRSTTELMNHFYTEVTQGQTYATALRDAKLAMRKGSFRKPYYWAPFQLYSRNLSDNDGSR